ncbi:hypothetical protein DFH07DRAFT_771663 [Mycena maculata]|uniref:Uncharacterized protein n=1 Tax=Mycena maculata TaxID=230809 RepID=A0AAD7JAQ7_9AGAR|nr:hypothetical protein DFH07DRAFT_771663 [Mycena maculata]
MFRAFLHLCQEGISSSSNSIGVEGVSVENSNTSPVADLVQGDPWQQQEPERSKAEGLGCKIGLNIQDLTSKYCVLYLHPNVLVPVVFGVALHLRVVKVHNTEVG